MDLYKKHMGKGYVDSSTFDYKDKNGQAQVNMTNDLDTKRAPVLVWIAKS